MAKQQQETAAAENGSKNPLLEESQGAERAAKFLILGARREGGQMAVVDFADTQGVADSVGAALTKTGWSTVEVYRRVSAHARSK